MFRSGLYGWIAPAIAVLALLIGSVAPQTDDAPSDLAEQIDEILTDERVDGTGHGVVVRDADSGETLYERNPEFRLMPASNTKMISSAAALELLGSDYTYTTTVHTDGETAGNSGVLHGDVYLKGDGDPTMLESDYQDLAAQVADAGIRLVHGDVIGDDTRFDSQRQGPWWGWGDEDFYYSAQISALNVGPNEDYDAGTIIIDSTPGENPGDPVTVDIIPDTDYVTIDNQATTGEAGEPAELSITRERGTNTWTVEGTVPAGGETNRVWRAVWEPTGKATAVFVNALEDHGVSVRGDIQAGVPTPDETDELASHESMTIAELLNPYMKLSNNGHGEVLLKTLGDEVAGTGDWPTGVEVISDYLDSVGVSTEDLRLTDGSGLSRGNQIPAQEFATLLYEIQDAEWFDTWYEELPIACAEDRMVGGTLMARMCDTPAEGNVYAKTGTLTGVTALGGYVTDADGRDLIFSVMFNNNLEDVKDLEDQIAVTLASYSEDDAADVAPMVIDPSHEPDPGAECTWLKGDDTPGDC